mmetsp:Transcript_7845/g.11206  ORF Transcript_7845/g.11206 Transcript_7845/m.11206 type:complete len:386 (-) Transcript_7845:610-1767(-)|eukprot:CAMPEP_0184860106 /NCGR_PEP_ID=MMETSP0580-20130426/5052_1 /TAXON_ID=1118495 /ORGANISM="Dactyliosolen fragilissimus" /LENGTH=385 /DNA_ID=CAMNT_0027357081 /DNA_START=25 /DNA_END=1182 /DNA_ORIENTATION=-
MAPTQQQSREAKTRLLSGGKATKARVTRYLQEHAESKLIEGPKSILLLKGIRCSQSMNTVLKDLRSMAAPHAKLLSKQNAITPIADESGRQSLEFLTTKNDCSLFAMASHNQKRPNNLILGRTYDRQLLDIAELGILRYVALNDRRGGSVPKKRVGSKPMMLFHGDKWHLDPTYERLKNLLLDLFRGDPVQKIVLSGLDHILTFTIADDPHRIVTNKDEAPHGNTTAPNTPSSSSSSSSKPIIRMRTYYCKLKKGPPSKNNAPLPHLINCGPDMDFKLRRTELATPDIYREALRQPARKSPAKGKTQRKNQTTNVFGETIGRLHLEKQNIDQMGGKKSKALKRADQMEKEEEQKLIDQELDRESHHLGQEFQQTFGFDQSSSQDE